MNTHGIELPHPALAGYLNVETEVYTVAEVQQIIEADRKRRGEPVAWSANTNVNPSPTYQRPPPPPPPPPFQPMAREYVERFGGLVRKDSAPQPAEPVKDETLWCLHVLGPDDVHAAPSKAYAEVAADLHNVRFGEASKESGVMCKAVVAPWPYDPASHARGLVNFVSNWIAPQPQQNPEGIQMLLDSLVLARDRARGFMNDSGADTDSLPEIDLAIDTARAMIEAAPKNQGT